MKYVLYYLFTCFIRWGIRLASFFNEKAKLSILGRKGIFDRLEKELAGKQHIIWIHCSSLGEFEQGRPLIENLKTQYPSHPILLTFFSPSGYEIRKNYDGVTWVDYMPFDSPYNAARFLDIVKPSLVIFIKYEFWYYYLKQLHVRKIPTLLVSALFRENKMFFKWYGGIGREMLHFFTHLFVQDQHSFELLKGIGIGSQTSITGDTRFDRVIRVAENAPSNTILSTFAEGHIVLIAGSTWPPDEGVIRKALESLKSFKIKLVCAPHDIGAKNIEELLIRFPQAERYTRPTANLVNATVLIIDNMGMLSQLYRYATITYIGGGFGKGIHNILEAAVYGKPVVFGPRYEKFAEAKGLIKNGGAFPIENAEDLTKVLKRLLASTEDYQSVCNISYNYVHLHKGATDKILKYIQEKRLLTN